MERTERVDELLETLWLELIEKDKKTCDGSILPDADKQALVKQGLVDLKDSQLSLTEEGRREAQSCIRRHRLAERLFSDVLQCRDSMMEDASCKFEHLLHKGLDDSICTLLGHPSQCPHGRAIPEGECCREARTSLKQLIAPLTELKSGAQANVVYLRTTDRQTLQKLLLIGVLPNTRLCLLQRFPSYVIQVGQTQFALDKELASHVYVRTVD